MDVHARPAASRAHYDAWMTPRKLSFVVPAHNEARLLAATLGAMHAAAAALAIDYEIVVADDASTDATAQIANDCNARVISVQHRKISATRNSGARASDGDLIVFVDADTSINGPVLRAALAAIENGAIGGGATVAFDGRIPLYARLLMPAASAAMRQAGMAAGCFVFCSRTAFDASGGFDEKLFGAEELALSAALKKIGRFVILRESVTTSGRKLRTYSGLELLGIVARGALSRGTMLKRREQMDFWYAPRREDPQR